MDKDRRLQTLRQKTRRQVRGLAVVLVLFFGSGAAHAADWKTHYDLALALYQAQKFEDSIPEFQAAYKLMQNPGLLFNLAQAYRKAGHPREAIEYYDLYLSATPQLNEEIRHKVDSYLAEARNTLAALELEMKRRLAEEKASREQEPEPAPPPRSPPPELAVVTAPAAAPVAPAKPIHKRWWLWTAVGGAAAAAVVTGVAIGTQSPSTPVAVPSGIPRATIIF